MIRMRTRTLALVVNVMLLLAMLPVNVLAAAGTPPNLIAAETNTAGTIITLSFDEPMADPAGQGPNFKINDGSVYTIGGVGLNPDATKINLYLSPGTPIASPDTVVTISYTPDSNTPGAVLDAEGDSLAAVADFAVTNNVVLPPVVSVNEAPVVDIEASYTFDAGTQLANVQLKQTGVNDPAGFELSELYAADTVFSITVNNNGKTPYLVFGAGDIQEWSSTGANGVTTIKVKGVHFKFADEGPDIQRAVALAIQYDPSGKPDAPVLPPEYEGMYISTNGNIFTTPYKDPESGGLGMMVGGASGVTDGFFRAYLPPALLASWEVTSINQLQAFIGNELGADRQKVSAPSVTQVGAGMEISFDMEFSVHQVYVQGTYVGDFAVPNNSLLIGTHLFQLDDTTQFTAENVQHALDSTLEDKIYFKSFNDRWYELGPDNVQNLTDLLDPDKALPLDSEKSWPLERWSKSGDNIEYFDGGQFI